MIYGRIRFTNQDNLLNIFEIILFVQFTGNQT